MKVIEESLATAISASTLSWADFKTMPVEFVAAMAGTSELASNIFRAKNHDRSALLRATYLLAQKVHKTGKQHRLYLSPTQSHSFAAAALKELLNPNCQTCGGASVVVTERLKVACPACDGVGVRRYTDAERAQNCAIDPERWPQWTRRYEMVMATARASNSAVSETSARLG